MPPLKSARSFSDVAIGARWRVRKSGLNGDRFAEQSLRSLLSALLEGLIKQNVKDQLSRITSSWLRDFAFRLVVRGTFLSLFYLIDVVINEKLFSHTRQGETND